jgi:hypothetical protein
VKIRFGCQYFFHHKSSSLLVCKVKTLDFNEFEGTFSITLEENF